MELEFTHVCDMAFATEHSKNINIIGIFENINASNFPFAHPHFTVVAGVKGERGSHRKRFRIYKENEREPLIETEETTFEMGESGRHSLANSFINMVFPEPGKYEIEIVINDKALSPRASFSVRQI